MELVSQATGVRYEIAEGEHTVGRGPWLQITDKRVSRDHAVIRAENGTLALCPKHKNPCYYVKVGGAKWTPLCKDVWHDLSNGDTFSLLPNDLVFKVVMKTEEGRPGTKNKVDTSPSEKQATCPSEKQATCPSEKQATCPSEKQEHTECLSTDDALFGPADAHTPHSPLKRSGDQHPQHIQKGCVASDPLPLKEKASDAVGRMSKSPCAQPSPEHYRAISGEEPCVPTQPVNISIDMVVRQHSTNKPRSLPSWLTDIGIESKPPKKKAKKDSSISIPAAVTKVQGQSEESEDKPKKAKSPSGSYEKPHSPAKEPHPLTKVPPPPAKEPHPPAKVPHPSAKEPHPPTKVPHPPAKEPHPQAKVPPPPSKEPHPTVDRATPPALVPKEIKGVDKITHPGPIPGSMGSIADTKPPSTLPVCPYGNKCYRKNPAHFCEYSHVATPTSGDGLATPSSGGGDNSEKPECPYGTDCYRKNSTHRAEYKHSAPPKQRSNRQSAKRSNKRSVLEGDEDDEPNTYDYTDSFIDDDEEEGDDSSSYGEEDDDMDWAPDDSEDVTELVSDAKSFLANKKPHKPS